MAIILHDIAKVRVRNADEKYRKLTHDEYAIEGQIRDAELLLAQLQWDLRDVKAWWNGTVTSVNNIFELTTVRIA